MSIHKLSALAVQRAMRARKPGLLNDGGGLYLKNGTSWIARGAARGGARSRDFGLGAAADISLAEARGLAAGAHKLRRQGIDPIEARRAAKVRDVTFRDEAEAYITANASGWRSDKHHEQWSASLANYVYPVIGAMPVAAISAADVLRVLSPIWATKAPTASRVRSRIELILDAAKAHGHRDGPNPAVWRNNLAAILPNPRKVAPEVVHFAAMPYGEIAAFLADLRSRAGAPERALELLILTASRSAEVLGARWDEISSDEKLWIIPPSRTKTARERRVPLAAQALAVLESMATIRQGDFIFPGRVAGQSPARDLLQNLMRRLGRAETPHGFRASFRTWVSEATNFPSELGEMALGHVVGSAVERAYQRGDMMEKRRRLADAWAAYCDGERRVVALARDLSGRDASRAV